MTRNERIAAHLRAAEGHVSDAKAQLDLSFEACPTCTKPHYTTWSDKQTGDALDGMVEKLRRLIGRYDAA